jgi:hypothetical protein
MLVAWIHMLAHKFILLFWVDTSLRTQSCSMTENGPVAQSADSLRPVFQPQRSMRTILLGLQRLMGSSSDFFAFLVPVDLKNCSMLMQRLTWRTVGSYSVALLMS